MLFVVWVLVDMADGEARIPCHVNTTNSAYRTQVVYFMHAQAYSNHNAYNHHHLLPHRRPAQLQNSCPSYNPHTAHIQHLTPPALPTPLLPYFTLGSQVSKGSNTCAGGLCVLLGDLHSRNVLDGGLNRGGGFGCWGRGKGFHAYAIGVCLATSDNGACFEMAWNGGMYRYPGFGEERDERMGIMCEF